MSSTPPLPPPPDPDRTLTHRPQQAGLPESSEPGEAALSAGTHSAPAISGYEITGRLGEGGMGVVWSGTQHSTKRKVAIKFLSAASFGSTRAKVRFTREVE